MPSDGNWVVVSSKCYCYARRQSADFLMLFCDMYFQMLSMRNGLTLHPMCLPGVLQPVQIPQVRALFGEETESLHANLTSNNVPINQETSTQHTIFAPPSQQPTSTGPHLTNMFETGSTFGLESPMQVYPGAYQLNSVSEVKIKHNYHQHAGSLIFDHAHKSPILPHISSLSYYS